MGWAEPCSAPSVTTATASSAAATASMSRKAAGASLHKVIMVGSGGVGKSALTLQVRVQ